jgi:ABC-2 type transport system permease protein
VSWREVFRRDLRSVYRSRTGTAVAATVALFTVLVVGLMGVAADFFLVAAVGTLVTIGALLVMTFVGSPRTVAVFVAAFTAVALLLTAVLASPERPPRMRMAVTFVGGSLSLVVPLAGLLGSYAALVGERTTGSVRFLLGLPNSRDDAFAGKYLSRGLVVVVPVVVGTALAGVIVAATFQEGAFLPILGIGLLSVPYALLFVGLGLTASAYAETDARAVAVVVAVFALLRAGWPGLQWLGLQSIPLELRRPRPEWYFWLGRVNPLNAYVRLTAEFTERGTHPLITTERGISTVATTPEFAAFVLFAWTLIAPVAGLLYFRERDLL